MLVLTRKVGEEIVIGNDIRVRVVAVQGNQIRLGFTAPKEVSIQREELLRPGRRAALARTRRHRRGRPRGALFLPRGQFLTSGVGLVGEASVAGSAPCRSLSGMWTAI